MENILTHIVIIVQCSLPALLHCRSTYYQGWIIPTGIDYLLVQIHSMYGETIACAGVYKLQYNTRDITNPYDLFLGVR